MNALACPLCAAPGGEVIWSDSRCRVVAVDDADFPGFCRVIWHRHVAEMTDLDGEERARLMHVVFAVEASVRAATAADKINLASLGNVVPHLHWHVIPRWRDDSRFPQPIWAAPERTGKPRAAPFDQIAARLQAELGPPDGMLA